MPVGSLANAIDERATDLVLRKAPVPQTGRVTEIGERGAYTVQADRAEEPATLATEEPILNRTRIWVTRTTDGELVVHGSAG